MTKDNQLSRTQFETLMQRLAAQRETLLAEVRPLSGTMRNWKPNDTQRNINEILMHLGSEECRCVSRLGQKLSAPSEVTLMR
ncbi:MAG: hypothetical protein KC449_24405, partial [Anaerolineales bacterium]|nr:hypothetical protein [Anaerolineales bacterium]